MSNNELKEMSNEELWQLFPIILQEYDPKWPIMYEKQKQLILTKLDKKRVIHLDHIGSTSVKGLLAKPTVDILLQITELNKQEELAFIKQIEELGYIYSEQPTNPKPHMMFMKGYTSKGFADEVFHLHVRYLGDHDELYFCRYLRENKDVAEQYGLLKKELESRFKHDRDGYTNAKTDFIKKWTAIAKEVYLNSQV